MTICRPLYGNPGQITSSQTSHGVWQFIAAVASLNPGLSQPSAWSAE